MTVDLAQKYDLRVPRYTSYPTAPHFSDAVDGATYAGWLAELDSARPLSLYFHIPFCDSMCWFCGCYTKVVKRYGPVRRYLDVLLAEIELVADALPARFAVRHLHWGGGSPTMLKGVDWRRTIDALRARFDVADDAEIAVELDPREATEDYIAALAAAGVNRASIGVQDFDPVVQAAINRIQPFDVVERVCGWLRQHGIADINLDLMYGLPHQTEARVEAMVEKAVRLEPARVALFGYAHVPWMKTHQKLIDEAALPGVCARWRQFDAGARRLVECGYHAIGLDHFARPGDTLARALDAGTVHRNFQGYTTDGAEVLLGLGASAIGRLPNGFVQNCSPLRPYEDAIAAGTLPVVRGVELSADDRLRADAIERLMCDLAVDLETICQRHRADTGVFAGDIDRLAPLVEDGICVVDGARITVTEPGRPLVRLVAAAFDAYLGQGGRHSRAV